MTEAEIREILDNDLTTTTLPRAYSDPIYGKDKAAHDIFEKVYSVISEKQAATSERDAKIAQLEAKVYAYEAIISNSNFKMAVVRKKKKNEND